MGRNRAFSMGVVLCSAIAATSYAAPITYTAVLNGPSELPPYASPGTGFAQVDYDGVAHTMRVQATFSGLLGATTASHIHSPTATPFTGNAAVATTTPSFAGFPLTVTSGTYDNTLDLLLASSWNPSYVTAQGGTISGAEAAFASSLADGTAYFNIHTTVYAGGEIRGFLTVVPEPTALPLLALGGLAMARRRR